MATSTYLVSSEIDTISELNAILTNEDVASTTWAGANSIVTVGTITSGIWQGTPIGTAYGGTGLGGGGLKTSYIPFGAGTSAFATSTYLSFTSPTLTATYASTTALTVSGTASTTYLIAGYASTTALGVTGHIYLGDDLIYANTSTTTIVNNKTYAWTIATTTSGSASTTLFRIDTTSGAEQVIIGSGYGATDVTIGAVGKTTNLVFEASSTIKGQTGGRALTFGSAGDIINFTVNTGFGTTTPWRTLSVDGTVGFSSNLTANTGAAAASLCLGSNYEVTRNTDNETCIASSLRFKQNIETLTPGLALNIINQLQPVTYEFISASGKLRYGFIAEDVEKINPHLVSYDEQNLPYSVRYLDIIALNTQAIQEMDLNLQTLASTTASSTTQSESFVASFFNNLFVRIIQRLADATNGIVEILANTFRAKEKICVDDQCLTKDDIRKLLEMVQGQSPTGTPPTENPVPTTDVLDTEAPIITLVGNNPAVINVGDTYSDPGATVIDNINQNLGYTISVDGGIAINPSELSLDTSTSTIYTLTFSAVDQAGNIGTATRTVEVVEP
jgi:hypothetical protein